MCDDCARRRSTGLEGSARRGVRPCIGLPRRLTGSSGAQHCKPCRTANDPRRPNPRTALDPREVIAELATAAEPGVLPSSSGRFFGFVVGGATPAAVAADWLTSVWDQNAGLYVLGPAASVVEEVAGAWLAELFGLPAQYRSAS